VKWNWLLAVLLSFSFASELLAQGFTSSEVSERKHRDFGGKLCLETTGSTKALASNPKIFNHIIVAENHCIDPIKAQICYHGNDTCVDIEIPGRSRKEQLLGVFPAMQQFRYDVKERFNH